MPAYSYEHEVSRMGEANLSFQAKVASNLTNLRTYAAERTKAPSHFSLSLKQDTVTSVGYEQRGDLSNSFKKSQEEAQSSIIERRYALENEGFEAAKKMFFKLPLYSTVALFSPAPDSPIPGYPGHGVAYFYHILPGESSGDREIKAVAYVNEFSKEEQAEIVSSFGSGEVRASEEGILRSPISVAAPDGIHDAVSFRHIWRKVEEVYRRKDRDFACPPAGLMEAYMMRGDEIMKNQHSELEIIMEEIAERIAKGATQNEIAHDFNIFLGMADRDLLHKDWGQAEHVSMKPPVDGEQQLKNAALVFQQNAELGKDVRKTATPCGDSGGMIAKSSFLERMSGVSRKPERPDSQISSWSFRIKSSEAENGGEDEKYDFNKWGSCKTCGENRMVGPCDLCMGCDGRARGGETLEAYEGGSGESYQETF